MRVRADAHVRVDAGSEDWKAHAGYMTRVKNSGPCFFGQFDLWGNSRSREGRSAPDGRPARLPAASAEAPPRFRPEPVPLGDRASPPVRVACNGDRWRLRVPPGANVGRGRAEPLRHGETRDASLRAWRPPCGGRKVRSNRGLQRTDLCISLE